MVCIDFIEETFLDRSTQVFVILHPADIAFDIKRSTRVKNVNQPGSPTVVLQEATLGENCPSYNNNNIISVNMACIENNITLTLFIKVQTVCRPLDGSLSLRLHQLN